MDELTQARWTELQFYYICTDLLSLRNNMLDVMDMIDNLTIFGNYNPEQLKMLAQEMIASIRCRPSKEEFCILCHLNKVPVTKIKEKIPKLHNKTYYAILEEHEKNPRMFYPRLRPEQLTLIIPFVEAFNKFKGVGL